jgi:hypothetical protein
MFMGSIHRLMQTDNHHCNYLKIQQIVQQQKHKLAYIFGGQQFPKSCNMANSQVHYMHIVTNLETKTKIIRKWTRENCKRIRCMANCIQILAQKHSDLFSSNISYPRVLHKAM